MSTYTMKKKRRADTNKKNGGANINSNNTNSNNNNNVIVPPDKHHNGSTPCSNSAVDIVNEIFPSIAISAATATLDDKADSGGGKQKGNKNKSDIPTENNNTTTATNNKPEPPLLGRMIQKYLLDERKSIRGVQSQQGSGGTKKKKKNKKKKKKSTNNNKVAIEEQVRNGNKGIEISLDKGVKKEGNGNGGLESPPTGVTAASTYDIEDSVNDQNVMAGSADENNAKEGSDEIATAGSDETTESQRKSPDSVVVVQTIGLSEVIDHTTPMSPPPLSQAQEIKDESPTAAANPANKENKSKEGKEDNNESGLDRLLDSIIDSPPPSSTGQTNNEIDKGRELQAFTNFLSKKLELYIQDKKKSESNGKSSSKALIAPSSPSSTASTTYTGGIEYKDVLPTISMSNATTLITSTDCRKCRTASQIHLRNLTSNEKQHFSATEQGFEIELKPANIKKSSSFIVLSVDSGLVRSNEASPGRKEKISKLSVPVSDRFGTLGDVLTDDIEGAFNYRNMDDMVDLEAGVSVGIGGSKEEEKNESFKLQLRPLSLGSDKEKYFQIGLSGGDDEQSFPISTKDIIGLVKHVLVPCGLGQGEDDGIAESIGRDDLGDKELAKIALQVKKRLKEIEDTFKAVKMKLYGIRTGLEEIDPVPRSSFDMKSSKMLMGFDEQLDLGFKQLGDLLLQIFKLTSFVGWSATRGFKFLQFTFSLLERFNHALDTLIDPVQQYRGNLIRATGRDGQVPQIYKHRVSRDGLQKLIEIKMNILGRLSQDMERAVTIGFQDGETSCMVEILVLQEYRRYTDTMNQDGCSPEKVFPDESSETQMTRLIAARINLAVSSIRKPTVLGMQDKAREQREDVTSLCKNIRKVVIAMEDSVSETKVGFLEMCYEKHESIYYEIEKNQKAGLYNDRGEEACDTSMLLRKSNQLMMQWLILLCSRQCNGSSQEFVTLPRDADKWLDSIVNADITKPGKDDKKACDGGNGQRRVSSVLAALIYRWLEERCKEWNAELTRDELLQSIGLDEPAVGVNEGGASAKSGKKKKSKRKGKNKEKNVVVVESSTDVVTSTDKDENVEIEITKEEKKDDIIEVSLAVEEEEAASIKLAESLVAMDLEESITTPTPSSPEGEWKVEKKTKRKGQSKKAVALVKDTTSSKKSEDNTKVASSKPNKKQVVAPPVKESSTVKKQEAHDKKSANPVSQTSNNTNVTKKPEADKKSIKSDQQHKKSVKSDQRQDGATPVAKQRPNADKPEASKSKKSTKSKSEQSSSAVTKESSSGSAKSGVKKQPAASKKDDSEPSSAKQRPTKKTDEGKKKILAVKQNPQTDEKAVTDKKSETSKKSSQVSSKKPDVQSKPQEGSAPMKPKADKKPVDSTSDSQTQVVSGKDSSKKKDIAASKTEKKKKKKKKEEVVVKVDAVTTKEQAKDQVDVSEMNQVEEEEEDFYFTIDEPDEERPTSPPLQAAFSVDAPDELVCPISLLLMTNDPVVAADGITYERASIEDWFSKSEDKNDVNSPVHGTKMPSLTLTPNISVRNMARALAAKSKSKQVPSTITTDQSSIPTQHDDDSNSQQYAYPPPPYGYPPAPQHYGYPQMPPQYNYPNGGPMPPPQYNYPPAPPNQQVPPQYGGYPPPQYSYPPPPNMDPNMMHHHYAGQVPYHPGYPYPTVGIEDRQQVMAPEMYLVQRLEKVASNDSGDNENGKEEAPIVWL